MTKQTFTSKQRDAIMREARENLERPVQRREAPVEDALERWRREHQEIEARREAAVGRDHAFERRVDELEQHVATEIAKLRSEIEGSQAFAFNVLREFVDEAWDIQSQNFEANIRELKIELAELRIANAELRQRFADHGGGGKVLDLPNPLRRVN